MWGVMDNGGGLKKKNGSSKYYCQNPTATADRDSLI